MMNKAMLERSQSSKPSFINLDASRNVFPESEEYEAAMAYFQETLSAKVVRRVTYLDWAVRNDKDGVSESMTLHTTRQKICLHYFQ